MVKPSRRTLRALRHVHPGLTLVVARAWSYTTVDFMVTEGLRSSARQLRLIQQKRSKTVHSNHLKQKDGCAHAVDVMAIGDLNNDGVVDQQDKDITWDRELYGQIAVAMKRAADELGISIRWGGDFKSFFDGPHFELF